MSTHIYRCQFQTLTGEIDKIYFGRLEFQGTGDADAAGATAKIEYSPGY